MLIMMLRIKIIIIINTISPHYIKWCVTALGTWSGFLLERDFLEAESATYSETGHHHTTTVCGFVDLLLSGTIVKVRRACSWRVDRLNWLGNAWRCVTPQDALGASCLLLLVRSPCDRDSHCGDDLWSLETSFRNMNNWWTGSLPLSLSLSVCNTVYLIYMSASLPRCLRGGRPD